MRTTPDTITCATFDTLEILAKNLKVHAEADVTSGTLRDRPAARPYPARAPAFWYLAPTSKNPSYHRAKFVVNTPSSLGDALVGIWFEKGGGPRAATMLDSSYVMDEHWIWHTFMEALGASTFSSCLDACQSQSGVRPTVAVLLEPIPPKGSGYKFEICQRIYYQYDAGKLTHLATEGPAENITGTEEISTLPELAAGIKAASDYDWTWISVQCGVVVNRGGGIEGAPSVASDDIWNSVCGPFLGWFQPVGRP